MSEQQDKLEYKDGHKVMGSHEEGALIRIGTHQGTKTGKASPAAEKGMCKDTEA